MSKTFIILSIFLLGSVLSLKSIDSEKCPSNDVIKVADKISLSLGVNEAYLSARLEASKTVAFDTLTILVKVNGAVVLKTAQPVGVQKMNAGNIYDFEYLYPIPGIFPSGNYVIELTVSNSKNPSVVLGCHLFTWSAEN